MQARATEITVSMSIDDAVAINDMLYIGLIQKCRDYAESGTLTFDDFVQRFAPTMKFRSEVYALFNAPVGEPEGLKLRGFFEKLRRELEAEPASADSTS